MVGPVLMLIGLARLSAVAGALLLNLEAPFTILLAVLLFGEHLGGRAGLAALFVVAAHCCSASSRAAGCRSAGRARARRRGARPGASTTT